MSQVKVIPIDLLDHNPEQFLARPLPKEGDKDWDKVVDFANGIEEVGLLNTFTVRPVGERYFVTDGNHRLLALKMNLAKGLPKTTERYGSGVPCNVVEMTDIDSLAVQLSGNHFQFTQKPASLAKQMQKLVSLGGLSYSQVAEKTGFSLPTVEKYLKLNLLPEAVKTLVDAGSICLGSAIQLTKLPKESMEDSKTWIEKASTETEQELAAEVAKEIKAVRDARKGTSTGSNEFVAEAKLISKEDIKKLYEQAVYNFESDPSDTNRTVKEVFDVLFQMDEQSIAKAKAEHEQKVKEAADKKEQRAAARKAKEIEDAKALLVEHGIEL